MRTATPDPSNPPEVDRRLKDDTYGARYMIEDEGYYYGDALSYIIYGCGWPIREAEQYLELLDQEAVK